MSAGSPSLQDDIDDRLDYLEDAALNEGSLEVAMLRKLAYRLGDVDEDDVDDTPLPVAVAKAIERVERLEERLDDVERDAMTALGTARQVDDGARPDGGPTQVEKAAQLSRDEVVRATIEGIASGARNAHGTRADEVGSVTVSDVRDMGRPEEEFRWQTVNNAWTQHVCQTWPEFYVDDSGEKKKLTVESADALSSELVRVVEKSLGRDDLAKRLVGREEE